MINKESKNISRVRRHARVRAKINGTAECPRLSVFRSNKNIHAQIIDDVAGVTLVACSSTSLKLANGGNVEAAKAVGTEIAKAAIAKGENEILCGNEKLMKANNIGYVESTGVGTNVYVAVDGKFLGYIVIADEIKDNAKETIAYLNKLGARTIMLTGDNELIARHVAKELGLTEFKASLLPQNKVEEVDSLIKNKKDSDVLCFIGDGINDAPVLMRSDVGISMGGVGSDAAIEASDIVLMYDDLKAIAIAKKVAKKTTTIVLENIIFAIAIKIGVMIASVVVIGILGLNFPMMWVSVFGDVGVAVIAILNAMRANSKSYKL